MKSDKTFFERLDTRIALAFLLLSLLSISLFAFVMYRLSGSLFAREDMRRTRASLEQSSEYVSSYLEKLKSFSSLIAMHPDIRSALAKSDKKSLESISALTALAENSDPRIRAVAVISKEGFLITSGSSMAMPLSGDMMQEKWYQDALSSAQMPTLASTGHGVFTMDREDWIISVCQEIRGEGGEHLGLVLIDVSYRFIEDYLSSLDLGKDGYSFILSDEGSLIYHPDPEIFEDEERKSSLLSLAGAGGAAKAPDGGAGTTAPSRTSSRTARPTATMCSQKPRSEKRGQVHTPVMTSSCQNRCTSQRASPPIVAVAPPTARLWTQTASTWPSPRS